MTRPSVLAMLPRVPRRSLTQPISDDGQRDRRWRVYVDGAAVERVASVVLDHPRFGTLTYGRTASGHDGWSFHEEAGGGSVIAPYARIEGALHVGVVRQHRPNQGGEVWNVPRGFLEPGEDRRLGAMRELAEEVGLHPQTTDLLPLPGEPGNPNSTFFETWAAGEGVTFFAVEVAVDLLARDDEGWGFAPGVLDSSPEAERSRTAEAIAHARFIPWWEAARLGDLFTGAAVARLLAHAHEGGAGDPPRSGR